VTRYQIPLPGCTLEPMAAYLKAVAVFRLVSEQADPTVRGYWRGREFHLDSKLDREALERFFLEQYRPTPIVAPWNGGSGFSEGDRGEGIDAILASTSDRFEAYRRTIREIFSWPEIGRGEMTLGRMLAEVQAAADAKSRKAQSDLLTLIADVKTAGVNLGELLSLTTEQIKAAGEGASKFTKPVTKLRTAAKKLRRSGGKDEIVRLCRNRLPSTAVDWIDCAVVLRTSTDLVYPPIVGTGGSEGRLDYTNSFMERVSSLLLHGDHQSSANLLRNALFAEPTDALTAASTGQLDPGRAGGYNQGAGIETKDFPTNYWNFVFSMEGAVSWSGSATRRQGTVAHGAFCSPFTVRPRAIGYGSAQKKDEEAARAEVWMPTWDRPCRYEELRSLLREGRVEWNGKPVNNALEFAEAAASLGADRGIIGFQRFSLIKRRGDSYLALPAGRIDVQQRAGVELLEEVDGLTRRIDDFSRGFKSESPAHFLSLRRQIDTAIYGFALRGGVERLQAILLALGRMERYFAKRDLRLDPKLHSPLSGLSLRWLLEANNGSLEFRIAVALASIGSTGEVGTLRANLTPLNATKPWMWAEGSGQTAWLGSTLPHRMTSILKRRLMDAGRLNCRFLPLDAAIGLRPEDAAAFIQSGAVDESRVEDLLFACTLVDWRDSTRVAAALRDSWQATAYDSVIPREYALLKHLFDPSVKAKPEPSILTLLTANRTREACNIAIRRLRASGCAPIQASYGAEYEQNGEGIRLAASLLLPIHCLGKLSGRVLHPQTENER
jgi:CRISPR-associated protein Csx17